MHSPASSITLAYGRRSRRSRGFTMIEILVVIGIILVLVALGVSAMQGIAEQGNKNRTRVALGNAQSMLAEFELKTSLKRQPPEMLKGDRINPTLHKVQSDGAIDIWRDYNPTADFYQGLPSPDDVKPYPPVEPPPLPLDRKQRTHSAAVRNTQIVLNLVAALPTNKSLLAGMSSDALFYPPGDNASTAGIDPYNDPATAVNELTAPVMLDGWGNPIIFVPSSGLRGVFMGGDGATAPAEYVITSVKPYTALNLPNGTTAPGARPFFASAGPDGVFGQGPGDDRVLGNDDDTGGDDNLYSFEN